MSASFAAGSVRARFAARVGESSAVRTTTVAAAGALTTAALLAGDDDGTVLCPFRRVTDGGYCPLCGGTRALGLMARGDFAGAFLRHPVVVLIGIQMMVLAVAALAAPVAVGRWTRSNAQLLGTINVAVLFAVWPLRLALGDIPLPFP